MHEGFKGFVYRKLNLSDMPDHIISCNLTLVFEYCLALVREKRHPSKSWPVKDIMEAIIEFAFPSFAIAKTVCDIFENSQSISLKDPQLILMYLRDAKRQFPMEIHSRSREGKGNIEMPENADLEDEVNHENPSGDDVEIESIFSTESMSSWQSFQPETLSAAVSEVASLLL